MAGDLPRNALRIVFEDATFTRYEPFADGRFVVARRGAAMGFDYGLEQSRRTIDVAGGPLELRRMSSPLPCAAGPVEHDVLFAPAVEICIPVGPGGFTDPEVSQILTAFRRPPAPASRA